MTFSFKETLTQRFACKEYRDQVIPKNDMDFILEAGRLAPSSCGFEPWKFVVLSKRADNEELSKIAFGQRNVATASHTIIIVARTDLQAKDEYIKRIGIAQLPNASALEVNTGLNINEIVVTSIECLAYRSSDKTYIPVPFISMANSNIGLNTKVNSNILYLLIETTIDRSNFSGWAEIKYIYNIMIYINY